MVPARRAWYAEIKLQERMMATKTAKAKSWTKPELKRLGEMKDVKGAQGAGAQAAGLKT